MADFADLYQEVILDHYRRPRGAAILDYIPESKVHENPACGDSIKVEIVAGPDRTVREVRFEVEGCTISTASASLMTDLVSGKTTEEVRFLAHRFIEVMRGEADPQQLERWGELACLKGVIRYPVRVKCATLAWHALLDSLPGEEDRSEEETR